MKNWVRVLALSLALVMVLGVSSAFADAYTIPKTLKNVEGLPENPEVPEMTTKNDGKTEVVTVTKGELVSLSANWNNELFPLDLKDGTVTFDITGKIAQLGMEGKTATVTFDGSLYTVKTVELEHPYWEYTVLSKNEDGSFNVKEEYKTTEDDYTWYWSNSKDEPIENLPTEIVTGKGTTKNEKGNTVYYDETKVPYAAVIEPGYYYDVPTGWEHVPESYSVPKSIWKKAEDVTADDDVTGKRTDEDGQEWARVNLTDETGRIVKFDENGNYYVNTYEGYDYVDWDTIYAASEEDKDFEKVIPEKQLAAMIAAGVNPEDLGWEPGDDWTWSYDPDGYQQGRYRVTWVKYWAQDINGYGKAFEGKTADGITVGYNRKGQACEKIIEMPAGTDFFSSETAPAKVTVTWQNGKNMYNNTVWYISKISQEYADQTVTASFGQGGQWNGIKKEAKAQ